MHESNTSTRSAYMSRRFSRTIGPVTIAITLLGMIAGQSAKAEDWPRWRGPRLDGISQETDLLKAWPNGGPRHPSNAHLFAGLPPRVVAGGRGFRQAKVKNRAAGL